MSNEILSRKIAILGSGIVGTVKQIYISSVYSVHDFY